MAKFVELWHDFWFYFSIAVVNIAAGLGFIVGVLLPLVLFGWLGSFFWDGAGSLIGVFVGIAISASSVYAVVSMAEERGL